MTPPGPTGGPLPTSPLHDVQKQGRLAFGDVDGWLMPRVYENIKMEYLSAKGTVGLMDRSHYGRLRVSGAKRLDLLNRLTTNDLRSIGPGQGARTALLTDKGRVIDDLRLTAREDWYQLITSPGNQLRVKEAVEKLRFRDDVALEDVTASTAMMSLFGPQSARLLESVARAHHLAELPPHHNVELSIDGAAFMASRGTDLGGLAYDLTAQADAAPRIWSALLERGGPYGVSPLGEEAWEMLRVEAGMPRFGRELTEEHNPLEVRLDDSISWNKGCYVGQEVVARLDSRQKVARLLVGLWLEPGPVPEAGSPIMAGALETGRLTSVVPSLDLRGVIGLGFVRNEHTAPGTRLVVVSPEDRVDAEVAALPFRR